MYSMVRKWIRFSIHETKTCEVWEWPIAGFLFETTSGSLALGVTVTTHDLIGASATLQCRLPTRHNSFTCMNVSYLVLEMWPGSQILSMYFHANRCHDVYLSCSSYGWSEPPNCGTLLEVLAHRGQPRWNIQSNADLCQDFDWQDHHLGSLMNQQISSCWM